MKPHPTKGPIGTLNVATFAVPLQTMMIQIYKVICIRTGAKMLNTDRSPLSAQRTPACIVHGCNRGRVAVSCQIKKCIYRIPSRYNSLVENPFTDLCNSGSVGSPHGDPLFACLSWKGTSSDSQTFMIHKINVVFSIDI